MTNLAMVKELSITDLSELDAFELKKLNQGVDNQFRDMKSIKDRLEAAINLKYEDQVRSLRDASGKETGVINFQDGDFPVSCDVPKKLVWNQRKLKEIAERITAAGDDPSEYIDISYKVAERKYTAWPEHLRDSFSPARTLKTGKPVYKFGDPE